MIAPRSSTIASAVRNMAMLRGALLAAIARMPSEKAMSVAIGIPQPEIVSCPILTSAYKMQGTIIPPIAALIGKMVAESDFSSPNRNSRLISSPMTKKKTAMSASLIQYSMDKSRCRLAGRARFSYLRPDCIKTQPKYWPKSEPVWQNTQNNTTGGFMTEKSHEWSSQKFNSVFYNVVDVFSQ